MSVWKMALAGGAAGTINGIFGGAGGMLLIPLLTFWQLLEEEELFPTSVSIMLPISLVSLTVSALRHPLPLDLALPYLLGGAAGGILAGLWGKRIPTAWLHKGLGLLLIWGGLRYLW